MTKTKTFCTLLLCTIMFFSSYAQPYELKHGAHTKEKRTDRSMEKWRNNRFGQFIHWGLYSIPAGYWDGKEYQGAAEWLKSWAHISSNDWEQLAHKFNPKDYNPKAWAQMAKEMGVKYVCITTKHHDGFCIWNSKYTDFDIASTPYKKDLLTPFVKAYNDQGIDVYFYYSILDWHNPDWRYDLKTKEDTAAFDRYKVYCKNQLGELQKNYPTVKGFWFDGTWDNSWKANGAFSDELEAYLKSNISGTIVNSRLRADDRGSRHFDSNGELMGDYESGYERRLPAKSDTSVLKHDWECCMTIPENQWGYHRDWSFSHVKSSYEILEMLCQVVSQSGNFLLNFGPNALGSFRDEEQKVAHEIGEWMKQNGSAIYKCGNARLTPQDWGYYTKDQSNHYNMIVFNIPISYKLSVEIPNRTEIESIELDGERLDVEFVKKNHYLISIPHRDYTQPFVIHFTLKNSTKEINENKAKV